MKSIKSLNGLAPPLRYAGLSLLFTLTPAFGQTVNWTKTLSYDIDQAYTYPGRPTTAVPRGLEFTTPTSGSTSGPTVDGIQLGYDLTAVNQSDTQATPAGGNAHLAFFKTSSQYGTLTLSFDTLLNDGFLADVGSLQWSDYQIEVSGGTATLTNLDVTLTRATGYSPVPTASDWSISGDGTQKLTLLSQTPSEHPGWGFNGTSGIQISGTWSTITITHFSDTPTAFGEAWDTVAGFTVNGATISSAPVPEPSSLLVSGLAFSLVAMRRRRC